MDNEKLMEAARAPALALAAATCKHVASPCRSCIVDAHVGLTNLLRTGYIISPPGSVVLPPEGTEEWDKMRDKIANAVLNVPVRSGDWTGAGRKIAEAALRAAGGRDER